MATIYDKASLVMIPSGVKDGKAYSIKPTDGSGDFTFSRGTDTATRVNASGLIEKERGNLLLQSNTFNAAAWLSTNPVVTSGQSGYDGTNDAWLLSKSQPSARIYQNITYSGVNTFSVYAKAGTLNWVMINNGTNSVWYDLQNGVVGSNSAGGGSLDASIEAVGATGWYRVVLVSSVSASLIRIYPSKADNDVSGTSGNIYIQDAQLESGLIATDYIETTTAAVYEGITDNLPRLDYSGGASCPSLLLEPSRTNLIAQSEYFSGWNNFRNTMTANADTSVEGVENAYAMTPETSNDTHFIFYNITESATSYSYSLFAKSNGLQWLQLAKGGGGYANFDLVNGVKGNFGGDITDSDIEEYSNGWYKITAYYTSVGGASNVAISALSSNNTARYQAFAGNGTDGYFIYGAQLESGSYPTSYIPTYGTAASRAEDVQTLDITSLVGATEGTLFFELKNARSHTATNKILGVGDGSGVDNFFGLYVDNAATGAVAIRNRQANVDLMNTAIPDPLNAKVAIKFGASGIKTFLNGSEFQTSSTAYTGWASSFDFNGDVGDVDLKQYLLFPTALNDAECIALTTI